MENYDLIRRCGSFFFFFFKGEGLVFGDIISAVFCYGLIGWFYCLYVCFWMLEFAKTTCFCLLFGGNFDFSLRISIHFWLGRGLPALCISTHLYVF